MAAPANPVSPTAPHRALHRVLNTRFSLYLLACVTLLGAGTVALHAYQMHRNARILLRQADRAEESGDASQVAEFLQRYLKINPTDTETMARYGLLLEKQSGGPRTRLEAMMILDQVVRREPFRNDVRRHLVDLYIGLGRFADARQELQVLLQAAHDDAELEDLLGRCEESTGEYKKAAQAYGRAFQHAPANVDYAIKLASLCRERLGQPEWADEAIAQMVQANPKSPRAFLARAEYRKKWNIAGSAADVARARELAPDQADVLLASAEWALQSSSHDSQGLSEARRFLERGTQLYAPDYRMHRALANLEIQTGRFPQAIASLQRGLDTCNEVGGKLQLRWDLATLLMELGRLDDARQQIHQLQAEGFAQALLDYLEAQIAIRNKQWLQAARTLERIRSLFVESQGLTAQVNILLGQCYEQLGEPDRQQEAYRRALLANPERAEVHRGLASALVSLGNLDEALEEYRKGMGGDLEARLGLVRLLLSRNEHLPADRRDWKEAESILADAAKKAPDAADVTLLRAELLGAQGRAAQGYELLRQACKSHSDQVALWVGLADWAQRRDNVAEAAAILAEAQAKLGDRLELRLARVRTASKQPPDVARKQLDELARSLDKLPESEQVPMRTALADAYQRLNDLVQAERLWKDVAQRQPDNVRVRLVLFDVALQTSNETLLQTVLDDLKRLEGEAATVWLYADAVWQIAQVKKEAGDASAARRQLLEVSRRRPGWSRVPLALAEIDELEGNFEAAAEHYQHAFQLGDRQLAVAQRLIELLYQRHRYTEADQVLRTWQEQAPLPSALGRLGTEISLQATDYERALMLARKEVANQPKNYRNHWLLGLSLWGSGDRQEAETELRTAVRLGNESPETWAALVHFLTATGERPKAEAVVREAQAKLPGQGGHLALAYCHEALGQIDQAEKGYLAALAARPGQPPLLRAVADFYLRTGRPQKAESYLRSLFKGPSNVQPSDRAWARRNLALVLAASGSYQLFQEALSLLETKPGGSPTLEDRHARAQVLAAQPTQRRQALRLFEEVAMRRPLRARDQFVMAQLYEAEGNWRRAREKMLVLLASKPDDLFVLASYIRSLLRRGEIEEAQSLTATLEKHHPNTLECAEIRARVLHAQGKDAQAVAVLKAYARVSEAEDPTPIAVVLDELGQFDAAEEMYRRAASMPARPQNGLTLAIFLARRDRAQEALDICERAWQKCPPQDVGLASVIVAGTAKTSDPQRERVAGWLVHALQQPAAASSLEFDLANLRSLQARYDEAEKHYRHFLQQEPQHVSALNDLACLLAMQDAKQMEALELVNRAIALGGPQPEWLDTRALVYLALGRREAAIADLEEAIAVGATPLRYFHLARAYLADNQRRAAGVAWQKAKSAGLTTDHVHGLEQKPYQQLVAELDRQ